MALGAVIGLALAPRAFLLTTGALETTRWTRQVVSSKSAAMFISLFLVMYVAVSLSQKVERPWVRYAIWAGAAALDVGLANLLGAFAAPLEIG